MNSVWRSEPDTVPAGAGGLIEVVHETRYDYGSLIDLAQHVAFLRPREDTDQQLLDFDLRIDPAPANRHDALDAFGNTRSHFSLNQPHEALTVQARSVVRRAAPVPAPAAPAWEACRELWRYASGRMPQEAVDFVFPSPMLPRHPALRAWAMASLRPGRPLDEAAIDLMHRLHAEFRYEPEATHVATPVLEAFERREGVCQDFAHVMIGALRSCGLAARYVSGYLLTRPAPGQPRQLGADASHAWVAVALPQEDGTSYWLELDPTNDCLAGPSYVRLAVGRDYGDVTPLRGVIRGGQSHTLTVRVDTRRVDT